MGEPRVFASVTSLLVGFAQHLGLDRATVLEIAGLSEAALSEPDELVPYECLIRIWRELLVRFPREPLALRYVELFSLDALGVVGYSVRHAKDGHAAMALTLRFSRLADPHLRFRVERDGPRHRITLEHEPRVLLMEEPLEMLVLATVRSAMKLVRADVRPAEVCFRHPQRHARALYDRVLGPDVPLRFDATYDGCAFDSKLLDLPLAESNPRVASYLASHAESLLASSLDAAPGTSVEARARHAIHAALAERSGEVSIEELARALGVSVRTLQRSLKAAGTSLTHEIDLARKERALLLLRRPELTVAEIAFMLGYAESRVFHRSFRRWTGFSPTEFRRAK